jgi:hypothetical protein
LVSNQVWHFRAAWWTPRRPKVDNDHLSPISAQAHRPSIKVFEYKLRCYRFLAQDHSGWEDDQQRGQNNSANNYQKQWSPDEPI